MPKSNATAPAGSAVHSQSPEGVVRRACADALAPEVQAPAAGADGDALEALAWLAQRLPCPPLGVDSSGWPIDARGRGVFLAVDHRPTVSLSPLGVRPDAVRACGAEMALQVVPTIEALSAIESIAELLLAHEMEDDLEAPERGFVLSARQRSDLLSAVRLLARQGNELDRLIRGVAAARDPDWPGVPTA